jgi:hypothetical protein
MTANPPTASGVITDSVPPAIAASASPYWIIRYASPTACAPVVQAVTVERLGPWIPYLIEMFPAASLTMRPVMKNGEMTRGLFPPSTYLRIVSSMRGSPPMPEPTTTATRVRFSSVTGRPESSMAKWAAPIA